MKQKQVKKLICAVCAGVMALSLFAGCGNAPAATDSSDATETPAQADASTESDDETAEQSKAEVSADSEEEEVKERPATDSLSADFTWLVSGVNSEYYTEYEDNPVYKYWSSLEWDADGDGLGRNLTVDFMSPPPGGESDFCNTLIATGEYPDLMIMSHFSDSAASLYDEGIALDITEYVEKYMPNYLAWAEEHPEYASRMTNMVDGERKYIQLYQVLDESEPLWGGFNYRRDWIVKYGKNPETGKAFSGEWKDGVWEDDVVFPSGNTDPIYISDWEWMLDIFATALEEQGITDGYALQLCSSGYWPGDFVTGFGVGTSDYYLDEDGVAHYGGMSDGFRAYIQCMRDWYNNGWLEKGFMEHTSDLLFWKVDSPSIYSGKVGCWYGTNGQLGDELEVEDSLTEGIVVFGCPSPINDKYGDKELQGKEPTAYFTPSAMLGQSIVITEKAKDKDLPTLFCAIDYLYSTEGGLLYQKGFSKEQMAEIQDPFYLEHGCEDGAYWTEERDGELYYVSNPARTNEEALDIALSGGRLVGQSINHNNDTGQPASWKHSMDLWTLTYENYGNVTGDVTNQFTADQAQETSMIDSNIRTYKTQAIPEFISGVRDIDSDEDWETYCNELSQFHPEVYVNYLNEVLGND